MRALVRRVSRVSARLDPTPDATFLAYARAVIAWGGGEPDEATAVRFARALAGTRNGATWEGLVELVSESSDRSVHSPGHPARDGDGHRL